jgi:hypothetical protein
MRDLWGKASASLETLVTRPSASAELCVSDRYIPFLREDATDLANIRSLNAQTLRTLNDGGWESDAAVDYVESDDLTKLKGRHTGLVPVQLQLPGTGESPTENGQIDG